MLPVSGLFLVVFLYYFDCVGPMLKKKKKKFLFKVEQNGKYNTSEFAITSTSHTICTTAEAYSNIHLFICYVIFTQDIINKMSGMPATRRRHITQGGGGDGYICVAIQSYYYNILFCGYSGRLHTFARYSKR